MEANLFCEQRIRPCFFFFLCLFIIFTFFAPATSGAKARYQPRDVNTTGPNDALIARICKLAPYYELCVDVLKAGSGQEIVDEERLVMVAIRSTIRMAMQTSMLVGRLTKTRNEARYTTAYDVCRIRYADVVGKLADWLGHADKGDNCMAKKWVESAINDIATCDKQFNQIGMVNALSGGNMRLLQMCRNDVEILEHLSAHRY
ncbi:unnamed protein product [Victoria cruziana]